MPVGSSRGRSRRRIRARALAAALVGLLAPTAPAPEAAAEPMPRAAGALDVRAFGAVGDGVADDTAALLAAIAAAHRAPGQPWWETRPVYLPAGTYRVTQTLERRGPDGAYDSGMALIGEDRDRTILKLDDGALGFGRRRAPRAVVFTSSGRLDPAPNKDHAGLGEGNDAYANYLIDLTIDVGARNPGAVAVDYLANNLGAMRNVRLRASAESGLVGVSMTRKWPGPALLSRIEIEGFEIGIDLGRSEYGVTLERALLRGQRRMGLRVSGNALAAERVDIAEVDGPALANTEAHGLVALRSARLARAGRGAVVENAGALVLREVEAGGAAADGVWRGPTRIGDSAFALPMTLAPEIAIPTTDDGWTNVGDFGAVGDGVTDDTDAIQAALASGGRAILFPHGRYLTTRALAVPETVELIDGVFSSLTVSERRAPSFDRALGMFDLAPRERPILIRRLAFDMTDKGMQVGVRPAGGGAVLLQDIAHMGVTLVDRPASAGPVFAENTCCSYWRFRGPAGVWARQLNTEGHRPRILNDGAPLSILGLKTEQHGLVVDTVGGGRTEVFGGLLYPVEPFTADDPAFRVVEGRLIASYVEEVFDDRAAYRTHVLLAPEGEEERRIGPEALPRRGALRGRLVEQLDMRVEAPAEAPAPVDAAAAGPM